MKTVKIVLISLMLIFLTNVYSQIPPVFIPTAFNPNSLIEKNKVFKPISNFGDIQSYKFTIYNKQGKLVFSTKDTTSSWDGTNHGKELTNGTFSPKGTSFIFPYFCTSLLFGLKSKMEL